MSETDAMEVKVEIPPLSKIAVTITATKKKAELKYTATQCTLFVDGTEKCVPTTGTRSEITTESAVVDYGRIQDRFKSICLYFDKRRSEEI